MLSAAPKGETGKGELPSRTGTFPEQFLPCPAPAVDQKQDFFRALQHFASYTLKSARVRVSLTCTHLNCSCSRIVSKSMF